MTSDQHPPITRPPWNRPDLDAELVRALERERLRAREDMRAEWSRLATPRGYLPEAKGTILRLSSRPHPARVALASLVMLIVLGAFVGVVAASCTAAYCAIVGCG